MQRLNPTKLGSHLYGLPRRQLLGTGLALLVLAFALTSWGCNGTPADATRQAGLTGLPYAGATLTISCPDVRLQAILDPMARVWAVQAGATVRMTESPMSVGAAADVGVIPFAELGFWADRGDLLPVPAALKEPANPFQWSAVLGVYRGEPFAGWGGQLFGLPIAGDGYALVYRSDRFADPQANADFRKRFGRPLAAPATWEDFADAAAFFADRDKRPSLPRFTADRGRLIDLFSRVASCYVRLALTATT